MGDEGFKNKKFSKQTAAVQTTVKRLSKAGSFLVDGDADGFVQVLDGSWEREFIDITKQLSVTPDARLYETTLSDAVTELVKDAKSKNLGKSKGSYLKTV